MLSPLWYIGLAGNSFKGYFAHKLPLNRQHSNPLNSGIFMSLTHIGTKMMGEEGEV